MAERLSAAKKAAATKRKRQNKSGKGDLIKGMSRRLPLEILDSEIFERRIQDIMRGYAGVYALYEKYLQEGGEFVPKFKKALSVGSSVSPAEIGRIVGLDVTDPGFWELGFKRFEHFLTELERVSVSSSWK